MKKPLLALLLCWVVLGSMAMAASSYNSFNYPWKNFCKAATGTTNATVSIEAGADQNVFIDRIYVATDKKGAALTIGNSARIATLETFSTTITNSVTFLLDAAETGSTETQVLGSSDPMIPLWVGDQGKMLTVSCEGTAKAYIIVNGRIGDNIPANPSTLKGF